MDLHGPPWTSMDLQSSVNPRSIPPQARSPVTHLDPTTPHHRLPVGANHATCAPRFW